jgi:alpha-tubulin suppressor-like RCC1 family protein
MGLHAHRLVTATLAGKPVKFEKVAAGTAHGCGIARGGELFCWGDNKFGAAGAPFSVSNVPFQAAMQVLGPMKFKKVAVGGEHSCAIGTAGKDLVCWGRDDQNETRGGPGSVEYPAGSGRFFFQQFGGLNSILDVTAAFGSSCATLGNGVGVKCWGAASSLSVGAFGTPDTLTVGGRHLCAMSAQQASCVGANNMGQLGIGSYSILPQPTVVPVLGPPTYFATLSAGGSHTCGLTPDGDVYCWGLNLSGQVGVGSINGAFVSPTKVTMP